MEPLIVSLGDRSYPIVWGRLGGLGAAVAAALRPGRCVVVSDSNVAPLYGEAAILSLREAGFSPSLHSFAAGESNKTLDTYQALVQEILAAGVDRATPVLALGGGVVGDMAGFAAATLLRGLAFVQVPTTLLAMVDSSVGGKTGVNAAVGKNLVGAFHQPSLVFAPMDTLATLPDEELRCGLGEVVKHAVLADPAFFAWLESDGWRLLAREPEALRHAVLRCCAIKAAIVARDERETGERALLNLGHTVGHAIEAVAGYGAWRHGEAVAMGLLAEARCAVALGLAEPSLPGRIAALSRALGLPTELPPLPPDALRAAMAFDKKRTRGTLTVALPIEIGRACLHAVEPAVLLEAIPGLLGQEDR